MIKQNELKKFDTYIIAEIGINHNGDLDAALKLIDIAASAGCNAVKFQKRNPDVCIPEEQKYVLKDTPWGLLNYIDYKKRIEFGKREYDIIDKHCKSRNIEWSASAWDDDSLYFLEEYNLPFIKIPSAKINDDSLIISAVKRFPHVILSTGMSTLEEVQHVHEIIKRTKSFYKRQTEITLLHCNSSYPAPLSELNLQALLTLKDYFPFYKIGYSGHELTLGTTVAAVYLGAEIIERHITLDRNMWGTDQSCSVTPWGLHKMVSGIRELEEAYGDGVIKVEYSELETKKRLRG